MACFLLDFKPSSEPIVSSTFRNKFQWYNNIHSRKLIWKCRLYNGGHFVSVFMCCRIWSWSPVPCKKHGPRDSEDKNRGHMPRFLSLLRLANWVQAVTMISRKILHSWAPCLQNTWNMWAKNGVQHATIHPIPRYMQPWYTRSTLYLYCWCTGDTAVLH